MQKNNRKVILITGAGNGIGTFLSRHFENLNHFIIGVDKKFNV